MDNIKEYLATQSDLPQPLTNEQMTDIKSQFHPSNTANVNIVPYEIYDEDEHIVGEWREVVDGVKKRKPVYEMEITGTSPSSASWIDTDLLNVERVLLLNGICISGTQYVSIPNGHPSTESRYAVYLTFDKSTNKIYFGVGSDFLSKPFSITIQYTKTTDEWQPV